MNQMNNLTNWFQTTNNLFRNLKNYCLDYNDIRKRRIFIDRNSKVLLVAHADTVWKAKIYKNKGNVIFATGLDDRLGCWAIWNLSKELKTDMLITDLEESAKTTATYHQCKEYNWIVEFDRQGDDVVFYDVGSEKFESALNKFYKIGWGTFSDISLLETTAACANIGIGYYEDHSKNSWANLSTTKHQMEQFKKFYKKYKDVAFVRDYKSNLYSPWNYSYYYNSAHCDMCGCQKPVSEFEELEIDGDIWLLCSDCYNILKCDKKNNGKKNNGKIQCENCLSTIDKDTVICPYCYSHISNNYPSEQETMEDKADILFGNDKITNPYY